MDSQIYHWGIKEDAPLGGAGRGQNRISSGASSDASTVDALGGGSPGQSPLSSGASSAVFGVDALGGGRPGTSPNTTGASSAMTVDENTIPQPPFAVKFGRARRPLKINETPSGSTKPGVTAQGGVTVGPDGTSESVGASGSSSALASETTTPYDSNDNIPDATPEVNTENAGPKPLAGPERLYMTAAMAKRKAGVVENTIDPNGRARSLLPASEYKIADISANVNSAAAAKIKADGSAVCLFCPLRRAGNHIRP